MTDLLDATVSIALTVADHVHHDVTEEWFAGTAGTFATFPLTQDALVRTWLGGGSTSADAVTVLRSVTASERHEFWSDDQRFEDVDLRGVVGHRQLTDAYLAALTQVRGGRLGSLDRGVVALHADVAVLLAAEVSS